jgi:hypothetical protein
MSTEGVICRFPTTHPVGGVDERFPYRALIIRRGGSRVPVNCRDYGERTRGEQEGGGGRGKVKSRVRVDHPGEDAEARGNRPAKKRTVRFITSPTRPNRKKNI